MSLEICAVPEPRVVAKKCITRQPFPLPATGPGNWAGNWIASLLVLRSGSDMHPIAPDILRALVWDAPLYVIVLNADLEIEFINRAGPRFSIDEMVGKAVVSYLPPESQDENVALLREVLATGETRIYTVAYRPPQGGLTYYETIAVPLRVQGEIRGIALYSQDSTAQVLAESQRAALQALLEKAEDVSHFGSFEIRLTSEGEVLNLSKQMHRILGTDPEDGKPSIATHLEKQIHPEDREYVRAAVQRALQHGVPFEIDYRMHSPAGTLRWLRSKTEAIRDAHRRVIGLVGIIHDITDERRADAERMQLEAQLRQSQKMEAVGTLASGVAHDFNNLLMGVSGCARIALDKLPEDSPSRSFIEEILRAVQSGAAITKQLLTFTRKGSLEPSVFDLNAAVSAQQTMLARLLGEHIELVVRLETGPFWVRLDPTQLEQVLMNLIVNARQAMPEGGRLLIETRIPKSGTTSLAGLEGPQVSLVVTDTGKGMDDRTRQRIFEPFFTTKEVGEGTGLGLSTVYAIVTQAGGDIMVESREGEGTTFRIVLPQAPAPESQVAPPAEGSEASEKANATILLVEDDSLVRLSSAYFLTEAGYHVLEAANGLEAMERWRAYPGDIDALVTDVVLPKMSGLQLAKEIQELKPDVKLLFMSAYGAEWLAAKWQIEPDAHLLPKPFDRKALVSGVREILGASSG